MGYPKRQHPVGAEDGDPQTTRDMVRELYELRREVRRLRERLRERSDEALEALQEQAATSRLLLENLRDMVIILDADGRSLRVAGNTMGTLGYMPGELLQMSVAELLELMVVSEDVPQAKEAFDLARQTSRPKTSRIRIQDNAGERRWSEMTWLALRDGQGDPMRVQLNIRDIDEKVQTEQFIRSLNAAAEAVQQAPLSVSDVIDAAMDQLQALDLYALVALCDEGSPCYRVVRVTGQRRTLELAQEIVGRRWTELIFSGVGPLPGPDGWSTQRSVHFSLDRDFWQQILSDRLLERRMAHVVRPLRVVAVPVVVDDQSIGLLAIGNETLSEQVIPAAQAFGNHLAVAIQNAQLVESLAQSEAHYRAIFEATQEGLLIVEADGTISDASPSAYRLFGPSEDALIGTRLSEILKPEAHRSISSLDELLGNRESLQLATVGVRLDGSSFPVEMQYTRLGLETSRRLVVINDISERLRTQEALVKTEKLSALGAMAAGIAHDFNNTLAGIQANTEIALRELWEGETDLEEYLTTVLDGSIQAAEMVRCLQSLYRQNDDTSDFCPVDVDQLVESVLKLTRPRWKDQAQARGVTIDVQCELGSPPRVAGNPGELRRVVSNLVVNAIEAMPEGGTLTVGSGRRNGEVYVTVRDTGRGMEQAVRERLFEPFFTTKRSSGLGLTVSHTIIQRHHGRIAVESELGEGTAFTVWLPAGKVTPDVESEESDAPPPKLDRDLRVLVVDDERPVRDVLSIMLERHGHKVQTVASAIEALAFLERESYDLLITDLGMPNMSGEELIQRVRKMVPEMPIILSTGWAETITPDRQRELGVDNLLPKPFSIDRMLVTIYEALDGS